MESGATHSKLLLSGKVRTTKLTGIDLKIFNAMVA